ncbi:MAG: AtzE family amidohydrolase [Novosphingobium sp.]
MTLPFTANEIAQKVRSGSLSALSVAKEALRRIDAATELHAVTRGLEERALAEAAAVDATVERGDDPGPLAGVPYGVKDLFDVMGEVTTAGAARLEHASPASNDAEAIVRLKRSGAVLLATLNMDEFAYGFVTDNARWGITRNPHDRERFAGGSSGGSAAAVAAGLVSFALGSDTNGSIRIPASLCGVYGIKPTHGSLPMTGAYPFVHTLDDIGILAREAEDLQLVDGVLRGEVHEPATDTMPSLALLEGWFGQDLTSGMRDALDRFIGQLDPVPVVNLTGVAQARSAAFLITAYEGGQLHREALREAPLSFDPGTRDRLLAGAALDKAVYREALDFRAAFALQFDEVFARHDILVAPAVMGEAPRIDQPTVLIGGQPRPARANLGLFTQPISFLGLPVVTVPLKTDGLPLGIQLIGRKGTDAQLIAFAMKLSRLGLVQAHLLAA